MCKRWLVELHQLLAAKGLAEHVKQVAWIHDEVQLEVPEDLAETVGKLAVEAIIIAGKYFNIRVPLDGEYKIGNNWAECH